MAWGDPSSVSPGKPEPVCALHFRSRFRQLTGEQARSCFEESVSATSGDSGCDREGQRGFCGPGDICFVAQVLVAWFV